MKPDETALTSGPALAYVFESPLTSATMPALAQQYGISSA